MEERLQLLRVASNSTRAKWSSLKISMPSIKPSRNKFKETKLYFLLEIEYQRTKECLMLVKGWRINLAKRESDHLQSAKLD